MAQDERGLLAGAKLLELSPDHIDEGERIGFLHEDKAAALGRLMAVDGQRDPIKVVANPKNPDKPWRLVTGMHRLIGARIEGITVWAIEVSGKPEDLADLEASENLHRRPLAPIEKAKFVAALATAAKERLARQRGDLKQQQLAVRARWDRVRSGELRREEALRDEVEDTESHFATAYKGDWEKSVGNALGLGRDAIYRALRIHRFIVRPFPEFAAELSKHPVIGSNESQLRQLADIQDEDRRRATIEALLADPEIGVADAKISAGIREDTSAAPRRDLEKDWSQVSGGWARLSLPKKREYLPRVAETMFDLPSLKLEMHAILTAQIEELRAAGKLDRGDA